MGNSRRRRSTIHGFGVLALAAAGLLAPAASAAGGEAQMTVSARVAKFVRLKIVSQPSQLQVSAADVARGWVEAPERMQVAVRSNAQDGYSLVLSSHAGFAPEVRVQGPGVDVRLGDGATASVARPPLPSPRAQDVVDLAFRFELPPSTQPGTYAWPIQVSLLPS